MNQQPPDELTRSLLRVGEDVLTTEIDALKSLFKRIDSRFIDACEIILGCAGHVVLVGLGKSGYICQKVSATLASLGTPSYFLHPSEALHGDLGRLRKQDVLFVISQSGSTSEILGVLKFCESMGILVISLTGDPRSEVAKRSNAHVEISVPRESCSLRLAPTASSVVALSMGHALAVAVSSARNFTRADFGRLHPAGALGRRLNLRVGEIMPNICTLPLVSKDCALVDAIKEMSERNLGVVIVTGNQGTLAGIFTDGDLRRQLKKGYDFNSITIGSVMTSQPVSVSEDTLATEAINLMKKNKINLLVVTSNENKPVGVIGSRDFITGGLYIDP